jgi:ATPase subunit of ABC transporter with duplicated ATPase domains
VLLVSHDRALLDAVAERTLAIEDGTIRSYDGGWADYVRVSPVWAKSPDVAPAVSETESKASRRRPTPERQQLRKPKPSELEQIEARIASQEEAVAELERRLAEDWSDVELLDAHRAARAQLQTLLDRWERLFAEAQASS